MGGKEAKGTLLDSSYVNREGKSVITLFVKTGKGIESFEDPGFRPYFYVSCTDLEKAKEGLEKAVFGEGARIASVKEEEKQNKEQVLKLSFDSVSDLVATRAEVMQIPGVLEKAEHDIPFGKRYIIDRGLEPMNGVSLELEQGKVKSAKLLEKGNPRLKAMAFDLETYSPGRFSDATKDPILLASIALQGKTMALGHGKKIGGCRMFKGEKEMVEALVGIVQEESPDVIATYNGDLFDFPYLKERASKLHVKLALGINGEEPRALSKGRDNAVKLAGRQHLDVYQMLRFLSRFSVVSLVKFDLESVVERIFGKEKEKVGFEEINKAWETGKGMERVSEYCKEDSEFTLKIAEKYLPLMAEICKITKLPLFDAGRATAALLVEQLIMSKCMETKRLIANKPDDSAIQQRLMHPIKGGYVKEPTPGLHENLAVLDFSSLYPTIMISHNVSPDTLGCEHRECREKNLAPNSQWFCTKKTGLVPEIIESLFQTRMRIKKQLKKFGKKSGEFESLNARQHAMKILLNSFYGYLGYSRSRFYCRECGSAITAWARQYVKWVGKEAEKSGFGLLYSDTDSAFLEIPKGKGQEEVKAFVSDINSRLPGVMNLDLEGFFKRGIFVTKESGEGAKKKYALIDYEGNLKIVGFEYVRRDWSRIAKETQRSVIHAILSEGKPEKAVKIVREKIALLKQGSAKNSDLVVLTQIKRKLSKYEAVGPHVAAAKKAIARGKEIGVGSVIGYIITRSGKSISDKAQLQEYVKEGNYDADYYIGHQVLPAVIKIMRELGYSKEDLIQGGKQHKLSSFL